MEGFVKIEGYPNYFIAHSPPRVVRKVGKEFVECKQTRNSEKDNYWTVTMRNVDGVYKKRSVHRLLMLAFVPNPENKAHVNHIDGDKSNNSMDNLEWATPKENFQHAIRLGLVDTRSSIKGVYKYSINGEYIKGFPSVVEASIETGVEQANIAACARGVRNVAGDFRWSYVKKDKLPKLSKKYVKHYEYKGSVFPTLKSLAEHLGKRCPQKCGMKSFSKKVREDITIVYKD